MLANVRVSVSVPAGTVILASTVLPDVVPSPIVTPLVLDEIVRDLLVLYLNVISPVAPFNAIVAVKLPLFFATRSSGDLPPANASS